jgi:hypothetical protein
VLCGLREGKCSWYYFDITSVLASLCPYHCHPLFTTTSTSLRSLTLTPNATTSPQSLLTLHFVASQLPPETRSKQARLFNEPDTGFDILVASDAIGMGLNLNIRRIIFHTAVKPGYGKKNVAPQYIEASKCPYLQFSRFFFLYLYALSFLSTV